MRFYMGKAKPAMLSFITIKQPNCAGFASKCLRNILRQFTTT